MGDRVRVMVVGGGGREHALVWRLLRSPSVDRVLVTSDNPGFPAEAERVLASGNDGVVSAARRSEVDLVVVGPEGPLADGLADALEEAGIPCFGPRGAAAALETSKAFAKDVMRAAGVPTAGALVVDPADPDQWRAAEERCRRGRVVLKADGLAAGKGVIVCPGAEEALEALGTMSKFGEASRRVLLEDLLEGPEASLFAVCDGRRAVPLLSARDHKTLLDGGRGPNTGGMGAIAPCPGVDEDTTRAWVRRLHQPVVDEMARRGLPFRGVLFAGLMLTEDGPRVLEYNVRFGDPECQALMVLWEDDPLPWLLGAARGALPAGEPVFASGSSCCVVLASAGYPETPRKGVPVPVGREPDGVVVFQAGTARSSDGGLVTSGGRVLGVTARGRDLAAARARAYDVVPSWAFAGEQHRSDIGGATR